MPCYHPLKGFYRINEFGKKDIHFFDNPDSTFHEFNGHLYPFPISIPCGQCIGCRLEYSRQWAVRCCLEALQWKNNLFLTLTYDDDHLPRQLNEFIEDGSTIFFESNPLVPSDLRDFVKNLRRQVEYHFNFTGLRLYYCGEYGSKTSRPHYHMILFNVPDQLFSDLEFYSQNAIGDKLYNSPFLEKIWKKGFVVVGNVTFQSCAYVARYILKKHKGRDRDYYDKLGLVPEFTGCSRRPGIAHDYYENNCDHIYETDEIIESCFKDKNGRPLVMKPVKYFDRLYDVDDHESFQKIKQHRLEAASNAQRSTLQRTSLSLDAYLLKREDTKLSQLKLLTRSL